MIFAEFSFPMMQEAMALDKASATGFAKLLAGKMLMPRTYVEFGRRFFKMTPEQILSESQENFSLNLSEIQRITVDYWSRPKKKKEVQGEHGYTLTILHDKGEFKCDFDADPQDMKVLRDALGERVLGNARTNAIKPTF